MNLKKYFILLFILFNYYLFSEEMTWIEPLNLANINSTADEFAPSWNSFENLLFFNSNISGFSKYYVSKPDEQFNFKTISLLEGELNQNKNNQSYITFETKDIAYISTFRQLPKKSVMNILQTRRLKNQWMKPFDVDSLKYDIFMAHPTVSPDGKMMVFSTQLNSKYDDTDLWIAYRQENGSWGAIMPMLNLNTPGNEITPYFASNDTLYFASNGQEGQGGYDIFISVKKNGVWQIPNPLIYINTAYDESDFAILPNQKAIFTSNRPGGKGGLDLYIVRYGKMQPTENIKQNINFSIASQVPEIKIKENIIFNSTPIFNYYFFNIDEFLKKGFNFSDDLTKIEPDSVHLSSPKIIVKRVKYLTEHNLIISVFCSGIDEIIKDNITRSLIKEFEISASRISINFVELNDKQRTILGDNKTAYLKFDSNNEKIFEPFDLNDNNIEILPPTLELTIETDKPEMINHADFIMKIGSDFEKKILQTSKLPQNILTKISDNSNVLLNSDSLIIELNALDKFNQTHNYRQTYLIAHSKNTQDKFIVFNNKRYVEYFLLIPDMNDLAGENPFRRSINSMVEKAMKKKNIIIRSFSDYAKNSSDRLKDYLLNQTGAKGLNIEIDNNVIKDVNSKKIYSKFLFSILVEI